MPHFSSHHRGNYDGLVVLTAVTRESLPNQPIVVSKKSILSRCDT